MYNKKKEANTLYFFILIVLLCQNGQKSQASELGFIKESIYISIYSRDTVEIKGVYYFENNSSDSIVTRLFYPFLVDVNNLFPHEISIFTQSMRNKIRYDKDSIGIFFPVRLRQKSTDSTTIIYKQKVNKKCATYILTTTQHWNSAFDQAYYSIRIADPYVLMYLSYECDTVVNSSGITEYKFIRNNFLPNRDIVVQWK